MTNSWHTTPSAAPGTAHCRWPSLARPTFAVEFIALRLHPVQVVLLLAAQELQLLYFGPVIGPQPLARRHQGPLGTHGR